MNYKHLFAALAAAFLLSIGKINAQTKIDTLPEKDFLNLLETDDKQAFALAQQRKLTVEQVAFFVRHQLAHQRNPEYMSPLYYIYWEQLNPVERLDYNHLRFFQRFYHMPVGFDNQFSNDPVFQHVLTNANEYKTAWGETVYRQYVVNQLLPFCAALGSDCDTDTTLSLNDKKEIAEAYLTKIKQHFPLYEPELRVKINYLCVYNPNRQPKEYYFWFNKYALEYIADPNELYTAAKQLILQRKEKNICKYGLKWVEKAMKIKSDYHYDILKAHLLLRTGKKRKAIKLLNASESKVDGMDFLTMIYLKGLWEEIAEK